MSDLIRDGLSGRLSWYHALAVALGAAMVTAVFYLRSRSTPAVSATYSSRVLRWTWLVLSVCWIFGVFYAESLDGLLIQELGEVLITAFVPVIVPPVVIVGIVHLLADISRP